MIDTIVIVLVHAILVFVAIRAARLDPVYKPKPGAKIESSFADDSTEL